MTRLLAAATAAALLSFSIAARGQTGHEQHASAPAGQSPTGTRVMSVQPAIDDVPLVDSDGRATSLREAVAVEGPVLVNFIFTSCTTICPVMTAGFAQLQAVLGGDRDRVRLVSISIDPVIDTPAVLKGYAERARAGASWRFLTGTPDAIEKAQRTFGAYRGDKSNHAPATYLRRTPDTPWEVLEGLASVDALLKALRGDSGEAIAAGERLYRYGITRSGAAASATVQGDLRVRADEMPCVNCHRRSGWGTAEGPLIVPPVVGSALFSPITRGAPQIGAPRTTGAGTRPAYTDTLLLRAVRDGIDPAGRSLSPTMPRYELTAEDVTALGAYLRSLSASRVPGVDSAVVHLATIVGPSVGAGRRASMLDVLRTYARHRNAGTRNEARRRDRGPWDMRQHYSTYREWVLHEWTLEGEPDEWEGQLERLYREQPVFAIVAGIADGDWSGVHAFSARNKVPVVLPQTPLPPASPSDDSFYSLYFSKGLSLEVETLSNYLGRGEEGSLLQLSRCGGPGLAAARAMSRLGGASIRTECIDPNALTDPSVRARLLRDRPGTIVAWLNAADAAALADLAADPAAVAVKRIFVSSSLLGEEALRLPPALIERATLVHPYVRPDAFESHAWRSLAWLKANGLTPSDRFVAANTLFAAALTADALGIPGALTSREYFIERIEHMAGRSPHRAAFPSVSFDARRRFASSICVLVQAPAAAGRPPSGVSP